MHGYKWPINCTRTRSIKDRNEFTAPLQSGQVMTDNLLDGAARLPTRFGETQPDGNTVAAALASCKQDPQKAMTAKKQRKTDTRRAIAKVVAPPSNSVDMLSQHHFYPPAASSAASCKRDCSDEHDTVQGEEERPEYSVSIIEGTVGEEVMQEAVRTIHQMACFNSLPHPCATFTLLPSLHWLKLPFTTATTGSQRRGV